MKKLLKRIFIILLIIIVAVLAWKLSLYIRARIIENKIAANFQGEYYRKTIYDEKERIIEEWHGEKYSKLSFGIAGAEAQLGATMDTWQDNEKKFSVDEKGNKQLEIHYFTEDETSAIFKWDTSHVLTHFDLNSIKYYLEEGQILSALMECFIMPFTVVDEISTEVIDGKECYAVRETYTFYSDTTIYYIEKDTNLIIRTEHNSEYDNTTTNYEYSFEPITKESIDFPNLEEYYVIVN